MTHAGPRVAYTGFGPFPGVPDNPAARLLKALGASRDPAFADCSFSVLEVAYASVAPALDRILALRPRALVMTGYSRHATAITLERVATDLCAPLPDASCFAPARITASARLVCPHIDFAALAAKLEAAGIPAAISDDAGAYVCNHTLFTALSRLAGDETPALFVHLPALTGTPLAAEAAGALPLATMVEAMALIATVLAP